MTSTGDTFTIPISILRGGTSRGVFFRQSDLPEPRDVVEGILLNVMGSPDTRQINGLGGATPQTSKVAIIAPSSRPDADVDYTFAQIDITRALVDWGGNCGNISSAVGPFAVNNGFVTPEKDGAIQTVRVHNTNTGKIIVAEFPVVGGRAAVEGDCRIAGVPGTGARIDLQFVDPVGSVTGKLLPTGNARDHVVLADGTSVEISIVDAANPTAFLRADSLGLTGIELPDELEARPEILAAFEDVRSQVAVWLNLVDDASRATSTTPGLPKIGMISPATTYETSAGETVKESQIDLVVRMMSMQHPHRACQITAGICTGVASVVPGTIVSEMTKPNRAANGRSIVRLGHPSGIMETQVLDVEAGAESPLIRGVAVVRTARAIMDGVVHVPRRLLVDQK